MKLRLIYYSTAYYAKHGGSTHSKHFLKEARLHHLVEEISVFPTKGAPVIDSSNRNYNSLRTWLRKVSLFQIYFFYRRNSFHFQDLVKYIQQEKPDAIIIRLDSNFLQISKLRKLFPDLIIGTEVNATPFDESFKNIAASSFFRKLERSTLLQAHCNFFVSNKLRSRIMNSLVDEKRDRVVPNGVDINMFKPDNNRAPIRQRHGFSHEDFVIGYIGTLDSHKHIDLLLKAFQRVRQSSYNLKLVIVGDGPDMSSLKQLTASLNLSDHVVYTNWLPHNDIPLYLNCFDLAIHHHAGDYMSPLKLFEYMACGVAVIGPNTSAVKDVFTDNVHLLITDGSVDDIASKILILLKDDAMRTRLASGALQFVRENYTWSHNADSIIQAIDQAVNKNRTIKTQ